MFLLFSDLKKRQVIYCFWS